MTSELAKLHGRPHRSARLLIVDDSETVRRTLAMRLGSRHFTTYTAGSGEAALALLERQQVDLVLLDLRMPAMGGLDVLRTLRRRYPMAVLPVIMLTVSDDTPDVIRAYELGANDYMVKPGELPVLVARINAQIAMRDAHAALRDDRTELERSLQRKESALKRAKSARATEHRSRLGAEHELDVSAQRYRLLYDDNPSMLFTLDEQGNILSSNRLGAAQLGFERNELVGRSNAELYHPDDRNAAERHLHEVVLAPNRLHRWELRRMHRLGEMIWVRETARVVDIPGEPPTVLLVCDDISETHRLSERLSFHERYDALTGLLNRRSFTEQLERALANGRRYRVDHAMIFLDLDRFTLLNDVWGHNAGDELLARLAEAMTRNLRRPDLLARMGDDEFAVLIEDCDIAHARRTAATLREAIHGFRLPWSGQEISVTASVGIVPITQDARDAAAVLAMADAACYAAKDAGRNRAHVFAAGDLRTRRRVGEMHWANRIRDAIAQDRLSLSMQTIRPLSAAAGRGRHIEILLRMVDSGGAEILPSEFLPAAERYHLAPALDRWVLDRTFAWLRDTPGMLASIDSCAINLSGQSLGDESLLQFLIETLDAGVVPASKLCLEVTETAAIHDFGNALRFVSLLKERGCAFALDDFGSGLSSFGYLKNLPVDYLKIDGVFVKDIADNSLDLALVRSINEIGHVLGKQTIAEFVETERVLEELERIGVDFVQGYCIDRPVPILPVG
ncbi:MAG: EAL domain-containing protein [Gammaproteobacteria bacterium]